TDARVLTKASAPREKASPKTTLIVALTGIGGLLIGCGLAVAMEHTDSTFRTPSDVERHLEISCLGVLPNLNNGQRVLVPTPAVLSRTIERSPSSRPDILGYVLEHPLSRFAETLRAVKVAADISSLDQKIKVIGVVSSLPGEGKSTTAANFANLLSFT